MKKSKNGQRLIWPFYWLGWGIIILGFGIATFVLVLQIHNRDACVCEAPISTPASPGISSDDNEYIIDGLAMEILHGSPGGLSTPMSACVSDCITCVNSTGIDQPVSSMIQASCIHSCGCCQALLVCVTRPNPVTIGVCTPGPVCSGELSTTPCVFPVFKEVCRDKGFPFP